MHNHLSYSGIFNLHFGHSIRRCIKCSYISNGAAPSSSAASGSFGGAWGPWPSPTWLPLVGGRQCRERQHSLNLIKTKISRAQQNGTVWRSPTNRSNSYLAQGLKLLLQLLPGKSACLQKIESGAQHPHPRARQPGSLELLRFHLLLKLKQRRHAEISATKA